MPSKDLYSPPDIEQAYDAWKASCGPAALAAILRRPVMSVRDLLPGFKGWLNPTGMTNALGLAGVEYAMTSRARGLVRKPPAHGLAFIQFSGGWWDGKPIAVQYRHTHWVAIHGQAVFDINAGEWWTRQRWREEMFPRFLAAHKCKAAWIRSAYEVVA